MGASEGIFCLTEGGSRVLWRGPGFLVSSLLQLRAVSITVAPPRQLLQSVSDLAGSVAYNSQREVAANACAIEAPTR